MRRTLAIVAVVAGFGAVTVASVAVSRPPVTHTVPFPIRPTPAQVQAEIQTFLLAEVNGGWLIGVDGNVVRVVLPPGATDVGHQLENHYGSLVRVTYDDLIGPDVTMLPLPDR